MLLGKGEIGKCTECEQEKPIVIRLFKFLPNQTNPMTFSLCQDCVNIIGKVAEAGKQGREAARSMSFRRCT